MAKREPYVACLELAHQGKVRDTNLVPDYSDLRLMVATDAVSTHNVVHNSMVPNKGYTLTALSIFSAMHIIPPDIKNHIVAFGRKIYDFLPKDRTYPADLHLRAIVIKAVDVIKVELIWRKYMAGSLWKKYYSKGIPNPYGLSLPNNLQLMSSFSELIFTPTEKSETDDPLNSKSVENQYPEAVEISRRVYETGREYAEKRGIDIVDFKCEIGKDGGGNLLLVDEWLNSDCCRFSETSSIAVGQEPPWLDKEIFRQYAEKVWGNDPKTPIDFPQDVLNKGSEAYEKVFNLLSSYDLKSFQNEFLN
jgi:phosphoribosylaminoimidazole-succinocarboxamide synthase